MKTAMWIGFCALAALPAAAQDHRNDDRPRGRPAPEARGEGREGRDGRGGRGDRGGPVRERVREHLRERADRNGDDRVSPEEIRALRAEVAKLRAKVRAIRDRREGSTGPGAGANGARHGRPDAGDRPGRGRDRAQGRTEGRGERRMMRGDGLSPEMRERIRSMIRERMQSRAGKGPRAPRD